MRHLCALIAMLFPLFSLQANPWTEPATILQWAFSAGSQDVAINNSGESFIVWSRDTPNGVWSAKRASGVASPWITQRFTIAQDNLHSPKAAINDSGDALAVAELQNGASSVIAFNYVAGGSYQKGTEGSFAVVNAAANKAPTDGVLAMNSVRIGTNAIAMYVWAEEIDNGGQKRVYASELTFDTSGGGSPVGGDWSTPQLLSTDDTNIRASSPAVSFDGSGNAMVVWSEATVAPSGNAVVKAIQYKNGSWGSVATLSDSGNNASSQVVKCDENGRAVASWVALVGNVKGQDVIQASIFNGTSWSSAANLSSSGLSVNSVSLAVNAAGQGAVVWDQKGDLKPTDLSKGKSGTVYGAFLSNTANGQWTLPTAFSPTYTYIHPATDYQSSVLDHDVGMDRFGNVIVVWDLTKHGDEFSSGFSRFYLYSNGAWSPSEIVTVPTTDPLNNATGIVLAMGESGNAVTAWKGSGTTGGSIYELAIAANYFAVSYPPLNVSAKRKKDRFVGQTDNYNQLRGQNHFGIAPSYYNVFTSDGLGLLSSFSAASGFLFEQHQLKKSTLGSYRVVTINSNGGESFPFIYSVSP